MKDPIDQTPRTDEDDGIDRRGFLECMTWAGTGVLWTLSGGLPRSVGLASALAAEAVKGGRVKVNGNPAKPSKDVRAGDRLEVSLGQLRRTVDVRGASDKRGPAVEAQRLYEETPESVEARERYAEERRLTAPTRPVFDDGGARPTKRDRRRYDQARRGGR